MFFLCSLSFSTFSVIYSPLFIFRTYINALHLSVSLYSFPFYFYLARIRLYCLHWVFSLPWSNFLSKGVEKIFLEWKQSLSCGIFRSSIDPRIFSTFLSIPFHKNVKMIVDEFSRFSLFLPLYSVYFERPALYVESKIDRRCLKAEKETV